MSLDLGRDTIFVTLAGSQAHGTAREGSDVDLRGVCVAPFALRVSLFQKFEQFEGTLDGPLWSSLLPRLERHPTAAHGLSVKIESVVYDVAKFLGLCAQANPNALELLFSAEQDWVFETPAWGRLHAERRRFLTRKVQQTYLGYALAQLKKIQTHRSWLLAPPAGKPARAEFGLPDAHTLSPDDRNRIEQSVSERLRAYGIDTIDLPKAARVAVQERMRAFQLDVLGAPEETLDEHVRAAATRALHLPPDLIQALSAERRYRAALKHWEAYEAWKTERNPARAELERRHGYDTKHAMHLVRMMRTGLEVLETGALVVRRPDAAELNEIRDGSLPFEALLATARALEERMRDAAARSTLPADVDPAFVDGLALELIRGSR